MGVVEEQGEGRALLPQPADRGDQLRLVPLVDDDDFGAVRHRLEIVAGAVDRRAQLRISLPPRLQPLLAMILEEVGEAPGALRLIGPDLMPLRDQLAKHSAQEVGVAMVPAGLQAMGEIDEPHAAAPTDGRAAASTGPRTAGSRAR